MTTLVVKKSNTKGVPSLEEALTFLSRLADLQRRLKEGSLNPGRVNKSLQWVSEGWGIVEGAKEVTDRSVLPSVTDCTLHSDIPLGEHEPHRIADLFIDGRGVKYGHRDGDFDRCFTAYSSRCPGDTARTVATPRVMTSKQMAQWVTGNATESIHDLSRAIVAQNLDINPAQWNDQIIATQNGKDILLVNGYASFAFARTGKKLKDENKQKYDEVVVLCADRSSDGQWVAGVHGLDNDRKWHTDDRLLLRNSP
ncbi:MAG: hypothetical protein AAB391_00045 [Patescibacteria group bacterium]